MKMASDPSVAAWVSEGTIDLSPHAGGLLPRSFAALAVVIHSSSEPRRGSLSVEEARILATILTHHTSTPLACFFGLWEGWGRVSIAAEVAFISSTRAMSLWEGTVDDASFSFEPEPGERLANLWWPEDRAWFVASEIDLRCTIVGGTEDCIAAILDEPRLKATSIGPGQEVASLI